MAKLQNSIWWYVRYGPSRLFDYVRYDIPQGLRNLVVYSPQIWRTREWDHIFLYDLIVFKLKRMEQNHLDNKVISDYKKVAKQIRIARVSLERVAKDEYPGFVEFCEVFDNEEKREAFDIKKFDKDHQMQKDDLKRFCDYFNKYSMGWWD